MIIRRLIIKLRIALTILFVLGIIAVVSGVFYLNSTGLNKEIRAHISTELELRGIFVEFDSLKYQVRDGLVAKNVNVYSNKQRTTKIASLPKVSVNLDKTKLLRGIRKINSLSLTDADIILPINPGQKKSPNIKLRNITGNIEFPNAGAISTSKITAQYLGINITLTGNLWRDINKNKTKPSPEIAQKRADAYQNFLDHLLQWQWDPTSPPNISLFLEGNINAPEKIKLEFDIDATNIEYNNYQLNNLKASGDISHNLLTIDNLEFYNDGKNANITMDYDFTIRDGRFDVSSKVQIQKFVKTFFNRQLLKGFDITGTSQVDVKGYFKLPSNIKDKSLTALLPAFVNPHTKLDIKAIGKAKLSSYQYLGSKFDSFSSEFSWNNGNIYLDKLIMTNPDGYLKGRLLFKNKIITYETETTLPKRTFSPFIKKGTKVETAIKQIKLNPNSKVFFKSNGTINANDLTDWVSEGQISLTKVTYNGLYAESIKSKFRWLDETLTANAKIKNTTFKNNACQTLNAAIIWKNNTLNANIIATKAKLQSLNLQSLKTSLSLQNKQIKLTKIIAKHKTGNLTGTFHTTKKYFHFDLVSSLDPYSFIPFIKNKQTTEFLSQAKIHPKTKSFITAKGKLNRTDIKDWESHGQATFTELQFNGVDLHSIKSNYKINHQGLLATNSRIVFDYTNYALHKLFKGSPRGVANIDRTYIDNNQKTATLTGIKGRAFPAQIARLFHKEVADHIEEYQFNNIPTLIASGVFDTVKRKTKNQKTNFICSISCPTATTRYKFLDGNLELDNFSASIHIIKNKINVRKIYAQLFGNGIAKGNLYFTIPDNGPLKYHGNINWQNIDFRKLGITYNFDEVQKGKLRGNIQFTGIADKINTLNTKKGTMGTFALEDSNLVSIPVLGPVSIIVNPFIAPIAGNKALNERLKDISARFKIVNGVIITDDIQSLTPSLTFFGEGAVNLNNDKIDITIRVNYRGLLGKAMELGAEIIKLPIHMLRALFLNKKPAETGLIQVRGRGHYKNPIWKLVPFDPPRDFNVPLFKPGKAQTIPQATTVE